MRIGIPKEIKKDERRVAMTPNGVMAAIAADHEVLVEQGAGEGSGFSDNQYLQAGATVCNVQQVWHRSTLIVKVKEPQPNEVELLQKGQILFTYLHLAAFKDLTQSLLTKDIIAIGYEMVQLPDGSLPLLVPMSEVAGRLSIQAGAYCLETRHKGKGVLLGGVSGVKPANVLIVGGGIAGTNAAMVAHGMGANVTVLDVNPARLGYIRDIFHGNINTLMSSSANIQQELRRTDLIILAVLIPGAKAPKLVTFDMLKQMERGSALVDISIDQGGAAESSRPTTHTEPTFVTHDIVHYCVANMPGAVPQTSTFALTNVTLPYILELASNPTSSLANGPVQRGINIYHEHLISREVAEAHDMFDALPHSER